MLPVPKLASFPAREAVVPVALVNAPLAATGLLVATVEKLLLVDAQTPSGAPSLNARTR